MNYLIWKMGITICISGSQTRREAGMICVSDTKLPLADALYHVPLHFSAFSPRESAFDAIRPSLNQHCPFLVNKGIASSNQSPWHNLPFAVPKHTTLSLPVLPFTLFCFDLFLQEHTESSSLIYPLHFLRNPSSLAFLSSLSLSHSNHSLGFLSSLPKTMGLLASSSLLVF